MRCPQCNTENIPGKMFCVKCGAQLIATTARERYDARLKSRYGPGAQGRKKRGSFIFVILALLAFTAVTYLATRIPEEASKDLPNISEENARNCELKFKLLAHNGKKGKTFTAIITDGELNSIISKGYTVDGLEVIKKYTRQGNISVDDLRIKIASDSLLLIFKTYVKFKYIYISLAGKVKSENGKITMVVDKVALGELPFPPQAGSLVARLIRPGTDPLTFDLPDYVKDVKIEKDKLVIVVGK